MTAVVGLTCAPAELPEEAAPLPADRRSTEATEIIARKPEVLPPGPKLRIEAALENVRQRDLLTTNGFWTVLHGILGLGPDVTLLDPDTGERVNALELIASGRELRGLRFLPTAYGLDVQIGPTMIGQGHQDQFIAEMAQWGIAPDYKFIVYGKEYTFMDFVRHTQMRASVTAKQELSWAIVVLGQYIGTDASWTNGAGEHIDFEDMIRYELDAPINEAACGGTHRLFGLTWAYYLHLANGGKATGAWKEVPGRIRKYRDLAKKYQNADGSFSTNFFRGPGDAADKQVRINTTGHTLEWLSLALTDAELRQDWMQNAANALALLILDMQGSPIEGGTLYHAVHGLTMYYERVYGPGDVIRHKPMIPPPPADLVVAHQP